MRGIVKDNPKRALYAEFARVARALGHPNRLEIVEHLAQGERGVEALAAATSLGVANVSQHLQQMKSAGIVEARRDGKSVLYRLADDAVLDAVAGLRRVAENNVAEVDRIVRGYFAERDAMEPVTREELLARTRAGLVTVIDVRPKSEFFAGHIDGAQSVPVGELDRAMDRLDRDTEIVAYCRGPWCVLSFEAVARLRARGFTARRLEDGFPEWKAAGLAVVKTAA